MVDQNHQTRRAAFLKTLGITAPHRHGYEIFRDFVTMAAISLHNSVWKDPDREEEYLTVIGSYGSDDQKRFPKLLALLVELLDPEPRDILGPLYMELEMGSSRQGQFFTPPEVSNLMAEMTWSDEIDRLDGEFLTLQEPACGAGGMVLAFVKTMIAKGHDPSQRLWVQCVDVDRLAALMCYVQLSLWHVPAEILVGNTLSWEHRERWLTPAHRLGLWDVKLAKRRRAGEREGEGQARAPVSLPDKPEAPASTEAPVQFDFGF